MLSLVCLRILGSWEGYPALREGQSADNRTVLVMGLQTSVPRFFLVWSHPSFACLFLWLVQGTQQTGRQNTVVVLMKGEGGSRKEEVFLP